MAHAHHLAADARAALQRFTRGKSEQVYKMLQVARIVTLRRLRETIVSTNENADAALAQLSIDGSRTVNRALHLSTHFRVAIKAEFLPFIKRAVDDADRRTNKDAIFRRLQHVDCFLIRRLTVVDHVDTVANRALHGLRSARVAIHFLAEIACNA